MKSPTSKPGDIATADSGKVRLGDGAAPSFGPAQARADAGKKVTNDTATSGSGKVRLGDGGAPSFGPGKTVMNDAATSDSGKVRLGDGAPSF